MSIVGYPASPLASAGHQKHPYFQMTHQKHFQKLPKHPPGTKFPQLRTAGLENHKQMSHDLETRNLGGSLHRRPRLFFTGAWRGQNGCWPRPHRRPFLPRPGPSLQAAFLSPDQGLIPPERPVTLAVARVRMKSGHRHTQCQST